MNLNCWFASPIEIIRGLLEFLRKRECVGIRLVGAIPVLGALGEDSGLRGELGGCIELG